MKKWFHLFKKLRPSRKTNSHLFVLAAVLAVAASQTAQVSATPDKVWTPQAELGVKW